MDFNKFTLKTQEAIQQAQTIAEGCGHGSIENAHLLKGMMEVDQDVIPYLLNKLNKSMSYLTEALALNFEGHVILEELFPALLKEKAVSDLLEQYRK